MLVQCRAEAEPLELLAAGPLGLQPQRLREPQRGAGEIALVDPSQAVGHHRLDQAPAARLALLLGHALLPLGFLALRLCRFALAIGLLTLTFRLRALPLGLHALPLGSRALLLGDAALLARDVALLHGQPGRNHRADQQRRESRHGRPGQAAVPPVLPDVLANQVVERLPAQG